LALATLPAAAAPSHRPSWAAVTPAPGSAPAATLEHCQDALAASHRYAAFSAQMTAVPGATRMGVRFELLASTLRGHVFHHVPAPGLGRWERSKSGVAGFEFRQVVANLPAPRAFRVEVSFRWYDSRGRLIRHRRLRSAICQLADVRPNLVVGRVAQLSAEEPGLARYAVVIRNDGLTDVRSPFDVALSVNGSAQPAQSVASLGAGQAETVTFVAAACQPSSTIVATVDPRAVIDETTRTDNSRRVAC
jgi:hypothetical protein